MDFERDELDEEEGEWDEEEAEIDIERAELEIKRAEMDEKQYEQIMVKMNEFAKRNANGKFCLICQEEFEKKNLKRHILAHHYTYRLAFKCPFCKEYLKSTHILTTHKCSNKDFAENVRAREYAKVKEGPCVNYAILKDAKYKCTHPNCKKSYTRNAKLKNHINSKHSQEKWPRLECLSCDQTCTNKQTLGAQVKLKHSDTQEQPVQRTLQRHLINRPIKPGFPQLCEKNNGTAFVFKNKSSKKTIDSAKVDKPIHELLDESEVYVIDDSEDDQDEKDRIRQRTSVAVPVSGKRENFDHENAYVNIPSTSSQQLTVGHIARGESIQNESASNSNRANSSKMAANGNKRKNAEQVVDKVDTSRVVDDAESFEKYVTSRLRIVTDTNKRRILECYLQEAILKFERAEIEQNM